MNPIQSLHLHHKHQLKPIHFIMTVFVMVMALFSSRFYQAYLNGNVLGQSIPVSISFSPEQGSLPPDLPVSVTIDSGTTKLAFMRLVILFDPTKVNLTSEPEVNSLFGNLISKSTMAEANANGKIVVVAGVTSGGMPPSGVINDVVTFTLSALSEVENDSVELSFDTNDMQLVESENITLADIVSNTSVYTLNPVATPTPTESPTPSPTISPSPSPEPSPTPSPTASPTPSPEPTGDTVAPTVNITSPLDGEIVQKSSTLLIQADATDNVGVSRVEFWIAGKKKCIDTSSPYECSWAVPPNANRQYVIQARGYDAANNLTTHQITVTSSN